MNLWRRECVKGDAIVPAKDDLTERTLCMQRSMTGWGNTASHDESGPAVAYIRARPLRGPLSATACRAAGVRKDFPRTNR